MFFRKLYRFLGLALLLLLFPIQVWSNDYYELNLDVFSRMKIFSKKTDYLLGDSSLLDSGSLLFKGGLDPFEVELRLKLEDRDTNNLGIVKFDQASIQVSDLFGGWLDIKFFDIGYGIGKDNSIRPDLSVRGMELSLKPMESLKLRLGYGMSSEVLQLYPVTNGSVHLKVGDTDATYTPSYHALKFDLEYQNLYVPMGFYYGIILVDGPNTYLANDFLSEQIKDRILHSSFGFSFDFLAYYEKNAMKLDIAMSLPLGAMSKHVRIDELGKASYRDEINFIMQFYGDVEIVHGIGLNYYIHFALDTATKQKTLGNLYDHYFKETFKISLTPRYTYGPVSVDLGFIYGFVGGLSARSSVDQKENIVYNKNNSYHNIVLLTGVSWRPFPFVDLGKNFMVRGYYKVDFGDIDRDADHFNELGLQLSMSFDSKPLD